MSVRSSAGETFQTGHSHNHMDRRHFAALAGAATVALGLGSVEAWKLVEEKRALESPSTDHASNSGASAAPESDTSQTIGNMESDLDQKLSAVKTEEVLGLSTETYTDPVELAEAHVGKLTDWFNDGAKPENEQVWLSLNLSAKDGAAAISHLSDERHIDALYTKDWRENDVLVADITNHIEKHEETLRLYFQTVNNPRDSEAYHEQAVLADQEPLASTSDRKEAVVTYIYKNNADKNRAAELVQGYEVDNDPRHQHITWVNEDGNWKIADIKYELIN